MNRKYSLKIYRMFTLRQELGNIVLAMNMKLKGLYVCCIGHQLIQKRIGILSMLKTTGSLSFPETWYQLHHDALSTHCSSQLFKPSPNTLSRCEQMTRIHKSVQTVKFANIFSLMFTIYMSLQFSILLLKLYFYHHLLHIRFLCYA